MSFVLRDYQHQAIHLKLKDAIRAGHRRIVLVSPTGSGKTEMGFEVVRGAVAKGKRLGFVANRINLVEQTSRRMARADLDHGIIQGANSKREYMNVLVCSIQTMGKRGSVDNIGAFDVLMIDEAHASAGSKDYRKVMAQHKDKVIIGLTATPFARGMAKHYDEVGGPLWEAAVVAASYSELIAGGYLLDCEVYAPSEPDMSPFKTRRTASGEMDYTDEDAGKAMSEPKLIGDIVDHWRRLGNDRPTVCFASTIAHSKLVVERFRAWDIAAEHVDCYTKDDERRAILKRVESGETKVISNVGILCEGWDFPACEVMILARPTRSMIRYMQMAGRILRPAPGKERALILDHSGSVTRLGWPTEDRDYELDDGKPRGSKKSEPRLRPCPVCAHVDKQRRRVCPACGHEKKFELRAQIEADGRLKKVERKATMVDKQQWWSSLLTICRDKGYKEGWAARLYREKFGVWPRGLRDTGVMTVPPEVRSWVLSRQIRYAKSKAKWHP